MVIFAVVRNGYFHALPQHVCSYFSLTFPHCAVIYFNSFYNLSVVNIFGDDLDHGISETLSGESEQNIHTVKKQMTPGNQFVSHDKILPPKSSQSS